MQIDQDACVRAVSSRDARFDGWFYTAVRTTGIYCRPSCPATTPKPANMTFYPSAAAAQGAGYRACKRCRPDTTPGSPDWDVRGDVVARAMRLIADGVVDRDGVEGLATRLGYSSRQVERVIRAELGAGPLALARSQRAHAARVLIETTDLPLTQVAFAAGFASVRTFNETVRQVYAAAPRQLRDRAGAPTVLSGSWHRIAVRLARRDPFEPGNVFGHLAATGVPGVEEWADGAFRRSLRLPHGPAVVALRPEPGHVRADFWLHDVRDLQVAISRCRRMLDLDADPVAVDAALAADPALAAAVLSTPGRRVPRSADGSEMALRIVLGQQVSTAAARTLARRLVQEWGEELPEPVGAVTHLFPDVAAVAGIDPTTLAMPRARADTLLRLAAALASGDLDLGVGADPQRARAMLGDLRGIGPWTIESVAMRTWGDPDAFPVTDLGLRKGAQALGLPDNDAALQRYSTRWSPWRAYATQHLWAATDHPINHLPEDS
ncbi:AlkA N-terminal domain-containing protein [Dermacoccaceae bacterium W4C1]